MNDQDSIKTVVEVVPKIIELLAPFDADVRKRAIASAMAAFGEAVPPAAKVEFQNDSQISCGANGFSPRTAAWMKQNQISTAQLQLVAHIDGERVEIIAAIPGAGRTEQILNAYVLQGLACFIATGSSKFDDKSARAVCEKAGLSDDRKAHSRFIAAKGNKLAGSKEQGWILTDPGLVYAATLVKQIAK